MSIDVLRRSWTHKHWVRALGISPGLRARRNRNQGHVNEMGIVQGTGAWLWCECEGWLTAKTKSIIGFFADEYSPCSKAPEPYAKAYGIGTLGFIPGVSLGVVVTAEVPRVVSRKVLLAEEVGVAAFCDVKDGKGQDCDACGESESFWVFVSTVGT